jgi:hypothetical protein
MISLSAPTYDTVGALVLRARFANAYQGERRGSVTATLDGGVSVYDTGYSVADQTLSATMRNPTRAQLVTLQYLVAYYAEVVLTCATGAFLARLDFSLSTNAVALNLRLLSRLDA